MVDRLAGVGPTWLIAECGVNHNGDPALAHNLVDAAADAGADAAKFQTFRPDLVTSERARLAEYQARGAAGSTQRQLIEGLVLPEGAWKELAAHASERGLAFVSTAFDLPSLDLVTELGVPFFKVGSGDLTNLPFLREVAARGRPVLVSTGMATMEEVEDAVEAVAEAPLIVLLHCVSSYPAPSAEANLLAIRTMRERFRVPVGWSDHTIGVVTALGAVALGASVLEKHLTLDPHLPGPDHAASADPEDLAEYVRLVRELEAALGDGAKRPMPAEQDVREVARRSWHAARDLPVGTVLREGDVVALRPASGIPPSVLIVGRRVVRPLAAGDPITASDVA